MRTQKKLRSARWAAVLGIVLIVAAGLCSCAPAAGNVPESTTTTTIIDWVDFIRFQGITYLAVYSRVGRRLQESDLGPVFAAVRFKLSGNVNDPSYRSKDGDAAFLDPGTPVYAVQGYSTQFRLAAYQDSQPTLFEADTNPRAQKGADLLDIAGKVQYIGVNSEQDGVTELGAIKDPQQIAHLVEMVTNAPVNQSYQSPDTSRYIIAFHLLDGTATVRAYWPTSGQLSRGILLPPAFATAVEGAVSP